MKKTIANSLRRNVKRGLVALGLMSGLLLARTAAAQQTMRGSGAAPPPISAPMVIPGNQGGTGGTTLELPATAPSRQM